MDGGTSKLLVIVLHQLTKHSKENTSKAPAFVACSQRCCGAATTKASHAADKF
jgi:hypothetical protein